MVDEEAFKKAKEKGLTEWIGIPRSEMRPPKGRAE